jgi:hypothetical protein
VRSLYLPAGGSGHFVRGVGTLSSARLDAPVTGLLLPQVGIAAVYIGKIDNKIKIMGTIRPGGWGPGSCQVHSGAALQGQPGTAEGVRPRRLGSCISTSSSHSPRLVILTESTADPWHCSSAARL